MQPLMRADRATFRNVRFVLTDMDETLTHHGRLAAQTYDALERLQRAGIKVIPVTAAPAGWCDQMARMWPVDGVIGENGGLYFARGDRGHDVTREFWHSHPDQASLALRLDDIARIVCSAIPSAVLADDQPFRQTSLAFARPNDSATGAAILAALRAAGADVTVNNLWILGWLGGYDKLSMTRRVLSDQHGLHIANNRDAVLYVGDSTNDAPMFNFFRHTVGVSTVLRYLPDLPTPPAWITSGPGGAGFVEVADAVLR